ncbi:MAG: DUF2779 domain-containing protein [Gemmatimonadaceae bacterium]
MPAAPFRTLSKSDFTLARTCDAKLYYRENGYPDNREYDPYLRLLAEGGYMVEALAAAKCPGGIEMEYGVDHAAECRRALEHLARDRVTLFQATLLWRRRLARVDILRKAGDVVHLVEVKAKSFDGAEHRADLDRGGLGVFRSKRRPFGIVAEWLPKLEDVTYQVLLLEQLLPGVRVHAHLLLVDRSKRSSLDDLPRLFGIERRTARDGTQQLHTVRFTGTPEQLSELDLLTELDVSAEVATLREAIEAAAARYESMLDAPFDPSLAVRGAHCKECEFDLRPSHRKSGFAHCWGDLAAVDPHVLDLHAIGMVKGADGTSVVESLVSRGKASLFDVPEELLARKDGTIGPQAQRQLRQIHCWQTKERWLGEELRGKIESLRYPIHFIDFEVSRLALPYHARMRPYGQVVFQWSCHTVDSAGAVPRHSEWLNDQDVWPNKTFVLALRDALGGSGPVAVWSAFEASRLKEIVRELPHFEAENPDLVAWIDDVVSHRIVDLHNWAKYDYYHPDMRGRTSIKVVLDALWRCDPVMRDQFAAWTQLPATELEDPYHALPSLLINGVEQDVREGTGAVRAYEAMMYGVERTDDAARNAWRELLLEYCKLDTLSMVLIFEHWRRETGVTTVPAYSPVRPASAHPTTRD